MKKKKLDLSVLGEGKVQYKNDYHTWELWWVHLKTQKRNTCIHIYMANISDQRSTAAELDIIKGSNLLSKYQPIQQLS